MNNIIFDELLVLSEIYNNLRFEESSSDNKIYVSFQADIKLNDIEVFIKNSTRSFKISYFPDLILNFWISNDSMDIIYNIDCIWLSLTLKAKLIDKLKSMENDYEDILWRWFQFLELECLTFLFGKSDGVVEIDVTYMNEEDLIGNDKLFDLFCMYDLDKAKIVFNSSIFECGSCLQQRRGINCIRLRNCEDVFCGECASGYFNTQIKNGDLELRCLICSGNVDYDEIKGVLNKEAFDRWDQLVLRQYLKTTGTAASCPRCETMSPVDDNCGLCPACQFAFCSRCNLAYHSGFDCSQDHSCPICDTMCKVTGARGFCRKCEYEFCSRCDNRYHANTSCSHGKRLRMLNLYQEELRLKKESRLCPKCKEGYEKIGGCNKMICPTCRVYFCYVCNHILDRFNPYLHFGILPQCPLA